MVEKQKAQENRNCHERAQHEDLRQREVGADVFHKGIAESHREPRDHDHDDA